MILINDNMLDALKTMEDNSVDSIVTDPPYHLISIVKRFGPGQKPVEAKQGAAGAYSRGSKGFMGKEWDGGDIAFRPETWEECWRVLKPGGHLLSFSSARTYHRMAVAIEDAGYEIRDQVMWVYGSGFPKSHNIGKNYDKKYDTKGAGPYEGWGTALKPSHEPICVARKPLSEKTVLANMEKWGVGGYNIDVSRVPNDGETFDHVAINKKELNYGVAGGPNLKPGGNAEAVRNLQDFGRWPANLIHDGSEEVVSQFPQTESGKSSKTPKSYPSLAKTEEEGGVLQWARSDTVSTHHRPDGTPTLYGDKGSAARFFYVPKVGKKERNAGVEINIHPTVKPIALMEYLIKMVTPTGGVVLDPFMGSGSTGCAAVSNGYDFVGIEMEKDSFDVASKRIEHWGKS